MMIVFLKDGSIMVHCSFESVYAFLVGKEKISRLSCIAEVFFLKILTIKRKGKSKIG